MASGKICGSARPRNSCPGNGECNDPGDCTREKPGLRTRVAHPAGRVVHNAEEEEDARGRGRRRRYGHRDLPTTFHRETPQPAARRQAPLVTFTLVRGGPTAAD
eukprot:7028900-Prymnesium_polylepis.3